MAGGEGKKDGLDDDDVWEAFEMMRRVGGVYGTAQRRCIARA